MIRVQNIINIVSSLSHFGTSQYKCYHALQEIDMSLFLNAGITQLFEIILPFSSLKGNFHIIPFRYDLYYILHLKNIKILIP